MKRFLPKINLHWQILIAIVLAVLFGIYLKEHTKYVTWMGTVFIRALQMIIVPLVLSSIVSGVTNIGSAERLGRLGLKTIVYYLATSTLAILTGLFLVNIFKPGVGADLSLTETVDPGIAGASFEETLIRIVPNNIFSAMGDNGQLLSVILFALLFGFFITRVSEKPKVFLTSLFNSVFEVMMKVTMFVIAFAPLGVFGLVAGKIAEQKDFGALVQSLGTYMLVVILGLAIHSGFSLPLICRVIGRVDPLKHFKAVRTALLTAFSTSSSNATLPLTIQSVEENDGVSNKIASFTLPLGATINMDGTALYECVAAMFIAQAYGIELGFAQQAIVVVTALLASIGAAGIPMAGLVTITIVLTAVGLPLEGVGLILAVDRLLDMFRTSVNVWSDACGAVVIARSEGEALRV